MNYKIINGDCRNMWEIPDGSIDLIFTSPPYFNVKDYGKDTGNIGNIDNYIKYLDSMEKVFKECYRVLKDGTYCIVNISTVRNSSYTFTIPFHYFNILSKIGFKFKENVIWEKGVNTNDMRFGVTVQNPKPRWYYPNNVYEFTLIFMKGDHNKEPLDDNDKIDIQWLIKNGYNTDVWHIQPEILVAQFHSAPFPDDYAELVIKLYSSKGETVLDPFLGSGTVVSVCKQLRRNCIGYEISPNYCELSKYRIGFSQSSLGGDKHYFMKSIGVESNISILARCVKCNEGTAAFVDRNRIVIDCEKCGNSFSKIKDLWFEYNSADEKVIVVEN